MRDNLSDPTQDDLSTSDPVVDRHIQETRLLYGLQPSTQWMDIAAVALVFGLLISHVDFSTLLGWALVVVIIISARIGIVERYRAIELDSRNVSIWYHLFLVGATLYGAMWSMTAILLVPSDIPAVAAFTAVVLCGLCSAEAGVSSINLKAFAVYVIAAIWPYAFFLMASAQYDQMIIGMVALLFSFIIYFMGYRTSGVFRRLVNLELDSRQLEMQLRRESRKRQLAENALLDNTLEEELAEKIRLQSLALKEGSLGQRGKGHQIADRDDYLRLLDTSIRDQLGHIRVFVNELEKSGLSEARHKEAVIVGKLIDNLLETINRATGDETRALRQIAQLEMAENDHQIVNIRRLINYLVQAIPLVYKARYITINRDIAAAIPATLYGNREALSQILFNLITNGIKHSDGGTVTVSATAAAEKPGMVTFTVSDTGTGMRREIVDFLRGNGEEGVVNYPGLAVVRHLVNRHGGNLDISSVPGVGTRVSFTMRFMTESTNPQRTPLDS